MKKRKPYKATALKTLQKEILSSCPFCSNSDVEQFEVHHIDENPENNDLSNLLMLCPTCHSKITKGFITKEDVLDLKQIISRPKKQLSKKNSELLSKIWDNRNAAKYELAMNQLEAGRKEAQDKNDDFTEAHFNFHWAVIQDEKYRQTDEAIDTMLKCLSTFSKYNEVWRIIDSYSALSEFEVHRQNLAQAKAYASKAMTLTQKFCQGNPTYPFDLSEKYSRLGWIEHQLGNYSQALEKYDLATSLLLAETVARSEKLEIFKKQLLGGAYHHIGLTYIKLGSRIDAKSAFVKSIQYYREIDLKFDLAKSLQELSHLLFIEAEYEEGESYLDEALALFYQVEDYPGCFRCIDLKIRLCYTKGEKEKAYQVAHECCEMLEAHQIDKNLLEEFYSKIGNVYFGNKEFEKAKGYYLKARKVSEENNNPLGVAHAILPLAEIESKTGNREGYKAMVYDAISILKDALLKIESDEKKAFVFGTIGHCYALVEEYQEALNYMSKAKIICETRMFLPGIVKCLSEMARIYSLQKQNDKSLDIMRSVKKMIDGSVYYDLIAQTNITLADYQIGLSNFQEADALLQEAAFFNKRYNLDFSSDLNELNDRLKYALSICSPVEISFRDLVSDLFELVDWFPEAKSEILRMWFYCRMEQIYGSIKSLNGVKMMIFENDIKQFLECASSINGLLDFSVQIVNEKYPEATIDIVPFPRTKEFYPKMEVHIKKRNGEEFVFNKKEGETCRYIFYGGEQMVSKITGNKGEPVIGSAPGLPLQAYELILTSNAKKLEQDKIFFFPRNRTKKSDHFIADLNLSKLYGFFPVYYKKLPEFKSVTSTEYFDFSFPHIKYGDERKALKSILNLKMAIKSLMGVDKEKWQIGVRDIQISLHEIEELYTDTQKIELRLQLLDYQGVNGREFHTVIIVK